MGKVTGFLEIDRQDRQYQPASDRIRHFREFMHPARRGGDAETRRRAAWIAAFRSVTPAARSTTRSPTGTTSSISGDWHEALAQPALDQQFPGVHRPRLPGAVRGILHAQPRSTTPVTIKTIECAIVDRGWEEGWIMPEPPAQKTGKRVAVDRLGPGRPGLRAAARARRPRRASVREERQAPAACCATAFPTSRWRSTTSTAA